LILNDIVSRYIPDKRVTGLIAEVVGSFSASKGGIVYLIRPDKLNKRGLPLGNLTSQLLVNIYLNEFDQFVKHNLKAKYYVRYADDFVLLSTSRPGLDVLLPRIEDFLGLRLNLNLHPDKVSVSTFASGLGFLGWVHFPDHRVLRSATKRRMLKDLGEIKNKEDRLQSYLGLLSHGNTEKLRAQVITLAHSEDSVE